MDLIQKFIEYIKVEKKYSAYTLLAYKNDIELFQNFISTNNQIISLESISYTHVRSWVIELSNQNNANTTINRKIASLKAFYKFLLKTKQIKINPISQHKSLKSPKKIQVPFSEKELQKISELLEFENDFNGKRNKLIIDLFYTTGIRRSELINLTIQNINLQNKTIKIIGKRNKERIIPVLDSVIIQIKNYNLARTEIASIFNTHNFFLLENGKKLNETFVYRLINYYFSNVSEKVKKSPHMLRHTFATHLLNHGADLNSIKELLGHASLASTQVYTHSSLATLKNVYLNAHPRNKK